MNGSPAGRNNIKSQLDQFEWDFSGCPEEELVQCYVYEYARESKAFCRRYRALRAKAKREGKSGYVAFADGSKLNLDCSEFPLTPWLRIPQPARKMLLPSIRWLESAVDIAYPEQPVGFNPATGEEVVKFEINWTYPKTKIASELKKWTDKFAETRQNALDAKLTLRYPKQQARHQLCKVNLRRVQREPLEKARNERFLLQRILIKENRT
jgi:hypothetical protein